MLRALLPGDGSMRALGAAKGPSMGSSETGLCLEHVPRGGAAQAAWPWPWVTSPWPRRGLAVLGVLPCWAGL